MVAIGFFGSHTELKLVTRCKSFEVLLELRQ